MSDKFPSFAAEVGTYVTGGSPDPKVTLSDTAANLLTYPSRTFAEAAGDSDTDFDDGDTFQLVVVKDKDNWACYKRAAWNDDTTDYIDLSVATLIADKGTISNSDAVTVYAQYPIEVLEIEGAIRISERSSDPSDPAEGETVIWMSDGTGSGDDGDLMIKATAGSTTKTGTLFDHSAA